MKRQFFFLVAAILSSTNACIADVIAIEKPLVKDISALDLSIGAVCIVVSFIAFGFVFKKKSGRLMLVAAISALLLAPIWVFLQLKWELPQNIGTRQSIKQYLFGTTGLDYVLVSVFLAVIAWIIFKSIGRRPGKTLDYASSSDSAVDEAVN